MKEVVYSKTALKSSLIDRPLNLKNDQNEVRQTPATNLSETPRFSLKPKSFNGRLHIFVGDRKLIIGDPELFT